MSIPVPHVSPGFVIWICGLSGAGKSTLAYHVHSLLRRAGNSSYILDGDALRRSLCRDLAFDEAGRTENIRRAAEVARMLCDCGVVVLASFMTPTLEQRRLAAGIVGRDRFREVFLECPVSTCEERDTKGLYKKYRAGEIKELSGLDAPFDPPDSADFIISTSRSQPADSGQQLFDYVFQLMTRGR